MVDKITSFMSADILWNSLILKSTQLMSFYVTPSIPVSSRNTKMTLA